jgi:hypothetical protein
MHRVVTDELIPVLHHQPGFAGALNLVNPRTGEAILILLWQSAEQAQRPIGANGANLLAPLLNIAGVSPGDHRPMFVWELTVRV